MRLGICGMAFEMLINLANEMYQRGGSGAYKQAPDSCEGIKK